MLVPLAVMMKLCASRWKLSKLLRSRPLSSKLRSRSVLNRRRVAERRRNRRSADKKRNVSVSLRRRPSARLRKTQRLSRCAPCSSNRCKWRSSSATSSSFAMAMSRTSSPCRKMTMIAW